MASSQVKIEVGYASGSSKKSFQLGCELATEAISSIKEHALSVVLLFASVSYDLEELLSGVKSVVEDVPIVGCTTAGEILDKPLKESVVLVAIASPFISVDIGIGKNASSEPISAVKEAIDSPGITRFFNNGDDIWRSITSKGRKAFALLFSPGATKNKASTSYEILEELKRFSKGRLPIFGGSTADDWNLNENFVLYSDGVVRDGVLVAIFQTNLEFGIGTSHGFRKSKHRAQVTEVSDKEVVTLNGLPADQVMAEMLTITPETLRNEDLSYTFRTALGIQNLYGGFAIAVPESITDRGGILLSRPVNEGTILTLMKAERDLTSRAPKEAYFKATMRGQIEEPAFVFVLTCASYTKMLPKVEDIAIETLSESVNGAPLAGFFCFGEQGLSDEGVVSHFNQTFSILVFGTDLSDSAKVALENKRLLGELEHARSNLQVSESRYRSVVEESLQGILVFSAENRIVYANRAFAEIAGYDVEVLTGMSPQEVLQVIHRDDRDLVISLYSEITVKATISPRDEFRIVTNDGKVKWVAAYARTMIYDKRPALQVFLIDISEQKHAELALESSFADLELYASLLRHDIANDVHLLSTQIEASEMLGTSEEKLLEFRNMAKALVDRMSRVLSVFGDSEASDSQDVVALLEMLSSEAEKTFPNLKVEVHAEKKTRSMKVASGRLLPMVFDNLLRNAAEFAGEYPHVKITVSRKTKFAMIEVVDDGPGMSTQMKHSVFQKGASTSGGGYGLYLTKRIVEGYGGSIELMTEEDLQQGTGFRIFLPLSI